MTVLDASTPSRVGPTVTASQVSPAFNPPSNSTLVLAVTIDTSGTTNTTITITNNGAVIPGGWVLIGRQSGNEVGSDSGTGTVAYYRAELTASRTGMTVTAASSITGRNMTSRVHVCTGYDATTPIGTVVEGTTSPAATTAPVTALTVQTDNALVFVTANESDGANTVAPTCASTTFSGYVSSGNHSGGSGYRSANAGTSQGFSVVAPNAGRWNWVAFELRSAAVASKSPPLRPSARRYQHMLVR